VAWIALLGCMARWTCSVSSVPQVGDRLVGAPLVRERLRKQPMGWELEELLSSATGSNEMPIIDRPYTQDRVPPLSGLPGARCDGRMHFSRQPMHLGS
jgi:hypothetical protein